MMNKVITLAVVTALALGAGFGAYHLVRPQFKSWVASQSPLLPSKAEARVLKTQAQPPRHGDAIGFNVTLQNLSGRKRDISEWKGNLILLNFWAPWCAPCRQEIPLLKSLQKRYGDRGLQIIGLALATPKSAHRYASEAGINYPVLLGPAGKIARLGEAYGDTLQALPFSVLINRQGKVVARHLGELKQAQARRWLKGRLKNRAG